MIRGSDGYEYENITQRLLGNPLENSRNGSILELRYVYPENEVQAFIVAYDKATNCALRNHVVGYEAGWRAIDKARRASYRS